MLFLCLLLLLSGQALAADGLETLFMQDRRLAMVAERLLVSNAPFCRAQMPLTGMILHSRDQYQGDWAAPLFAEGTLAVAQVLPGTAAEIAGLQPGDGVTAIAGLPPVSAGTTVREAALTLLSQRWRAGDALRLEIMRDGTRRSVVLHPPAGCHAVVEIGTESGMMARTDGHIVHVPLRLAQAADDAEIAVIVAHELAHVILQHRSRLEAAGIEKGLLGELGRNRRLIRQAEEEADRLSVHLLANAGFELASAPAFWRGPLGRRIGGGLLRHRAYHGPDARAALLEGEIADHLDPTAALHTPAHLLVLRDRPMGGDD
ncbi:M48 family metallopeptidase [Croceibacterium mercuriale]|uniref:M48 family metallopeptidase n=1 Tax=Croceibacterium mercuriale TaxID=1572751 RepID=UPI00068E0C5C|nr:M48 family metallopeptidase [Croceibacterium mercuriale]